MPKNWLIKLTHSISIGTIITALTVDHWYITGAIYGIFSTVVAVVSNIYFSRKADQRAEEQCKRTT